MVAASGSSLHPAGLVAPALTALAAAVAGVDMAEARSKLASGGAVEDLLVLLRSREKLEALEKRFAQLEAEQRSP